MTNCKICGRVLKPDGSCANASCATRITFKEIPKDPQWLFYTSVLKDPATQAVNRALADYNGVFSAMAMRNVQHELLTNLGDKIRAWLSNPPKSPGAVMTPAIDSAKLVMQALLKIVEDTLHRLPPPPPRRYDRTVCIGHAVATEIMNNKAGQYWKVQYSGKDLDCADLDQKCRNLQEAIKTAYTKYGDAYIRNKPTPTLTAEQDEHTLKIFMAPEFYFQGAKGAYNIANVARIMPKMREFTSNTKYKNWLFIFGTAIGATTVTKNTCSKCNVNADAVRYTGGKMSVLICPKCKDTRHIVSSEETIAIDNLALIQKGGEKGQENSYLVAKEFMSHVDFQRPGYVAPSGVLYNLGNPASPKPLSQWGDPPAIGPAPAPAAAAPPLPVSRQVVLGKPGHEKTVTAVSATGRDLGALAQSKYLDERKGGSVFTIDGIRFGLEVCKDHSEGRLQKTDGTYHYGIQIQLIPSAGMEIETSNVACVANGIVFNVDGGAFLRAGVLVNNGALAAQYLKDKCAMFGPYVIPYP